ncbi:MAG: efflux RND transporter permease subunit, partial [Acidobacteriota bacterium]|nr:efflux RND transporter permease subunit [Acidobacteriota bacterium]
MIAWFAKNHVAANVLMTVIVGTGLVTLFVGIRQEVFPEFSLDRIVVTVPYPGAAPAEVENGVTIRVEEAIQGLDGVKRITSTSSEGVGAVVAELFTGADAREVLDDIKARVDAIRTFPDEAEEPVIQELTNRRQVINVAVHGAAGESVIKELTQRVRDEIAALDGISIAELTNVRPYEIAIEVSETVLRRYGITFGEVADAVRNFSLDLPGGSVRTSGGEILLRTEAQAYDEKDFGSIPLLTAPDGTRVLLGEVARVVDGFAETDQSSRFDGERSAMVQVYRIGDQDALEISGKVKAYVEAAQSRMPEGVKLSVWQDNARTLRGRRNLLLKNAAWGFSLVALVLALFMRLRLAFWITLGIVISFFGVLALLPVFDQSINLISLFAFILVLGIIVDDAIIVGENIFSQQERTRQGLTSAIRGAQEVSMPVTFAVLTSIAAFAPLLNVPGTTGKIIKAIPIVVILALAFSLVESLLILPAHLSRLNVHDRPSRTLLSRGWRAFQGRFARLLELFIERIYRPTLELALEWRYLTVAIGVATLVLTAGSVAAGFVKFVFLPNVEADYVTAALRMPQGTPVEVTERAMARIERSATELADELEEEGYGRVFSHVLASVGDQPMARAQQRNSGGAAASQSSSHLGELAIELVPSEERTVSSSEIVRRWREKVPTIPDARELAFSGSLFSAGEAINVQLTGGDLDRLIEASQALQERLREYPGVFDVTDSFDAGKQEIELDIKPSAELLGLTRRDLARQVRQAFYGEEAQRIQRDKDEVKVFVRYPEDERRTLGSLEGMRVRARDGSEVPFSAVATTSLGRGYASIQRVDRRRAINVTADVDDLEGNANEIMADLGATFLPGLAERFPGLLYTF